MGLEAINTDGTFFERIGVAEDLTEKEVNEVEDMLLIVDDVISFLNGISEDDTIYKLLPSLKELREDIGENPIPKTDELSDNSIIEGIRWASVLSEENAIKTPGRTEGVARSIGTSMHILERALMLELGEENILYDRTDMFLFPIEEALIYLYAKAILNDNQKEVMRYRDFISLITTPIEDGGLGWREQNQFETMYDKLRSMERT